ncbi:MAG TPA: winged helix-turn-helix domain-containing protein [Nitrososphaera sp.]
MLSSILPEAAQIPTPQKQRKRNQMDVMFELLAAATEPAKKTHLLFRTKINYYQLVRYLDLLTGLGMLEAVSEPFEGYMITEKGRTALQLFNRPVAYTS